jgi:hypothetical protein
MTDLEGRLRLKSIASHLMSIAVATNVVIEQVQKYASREVENSTTCNCSAHYVELELIQRHSTPNTFPR